MEMLQQKIRDEMKAAMVAKDQVRLDVLRGILSGFTNELVAKKRKPSEELNDDEAQVVITRIAKQRKESIEQFKKAGRDDLVLEEETQYKVIEVYLPKMMERGEVDGLVVSAIHLALATLCGAATLAMAGFRPPTVFGYSIGAAVLLAGVLIFIGFTGAGAVFGAGIGLPTMIPSDTPTSTLTPTASRTPTASLTPTASRTPSPTPSETITPTQTPVVAVINVEEGSGAFLRLTPAGQALTTLLNGTLVHLLPEPAAEAGGKLWLHIYVPALGRDGWVLQNLVRAVTPQPGATP